MAEILYIVQKQEDVDDRVAELEQIGFHIVYYFRTEEETELQKLEKALQDTFYYCVMEGQFHSDTARACSVTGTKYLAQIGKDNSPAAMLDCAFQDGEWEIYEAIDRLVEVKKCSGGMDANDMDSLAKIKDCESMCRETDKFFQAMDVEKECRMHLKQQMVDYINQLLERGTIDAWNELLVWNKRYGVRELKSYFYEFYILWRILLIYVKELREWYEGNIPVTIINLRSVDEITEAYLQIIFLLRRLEYDIDEEAGAELVEYVSARRISILFVEGIIEVAQIENKEKVKRKLKELWG